MYNFEEKRSFGILRDKICSYLEAKHLKIVKIDFDDADYSSNEEHVTTLLKNMSFEEFRKFDILIEELLKEKSEFHLRDMFEEFCDLKKHLIKHGLETQYLDKTMKNFSEEDYEEAIVDASMALESLSKSVLKYEEYTDTLNTLIQLLYNERVIDSSDKLVLEGLRNCRNENAHGDEVYVETSQSTARHHILITFACMEEIISTVFD